MPVRLVITKKLIRTLVWFSKNQPIALFDKKTGPSLRYAKRLEGFGLVVKCRRILPHPELSNAGIAQFKLDKKGRRLLKENRYKLR